MRSVKVFSIFLLFWSQSDANSCRDIVDMKLHPIDCCTYPILVDDEQIAQKCQQQCGTRPIKPYCNRVCILNDLQVYDEKKLKLENVKNLFTSGAEPGNVGDKWKEILDESIKFCLKEHEVTEDVEEQDVSMVVFNLINCIRRANFVACPDMNQRKECTEMKEAIKTCDKESENMLFGVFHEERKGDMMKGVAMVEGGKLGS